MVGQALIKSYRYSHSKGKTKLKKKKKSQAVLKSNQTNSQGFKAWVCGFALWATGSAPRPAALPTEWSFVIEQFYLLNSCQWNFENLVVFFHFVLFLSLSVKLGSVSEDIKTFGNRWISHGCHGIHFIKKRDLSTDLSWVISILFLVSTEMMEESIHESDA